MEHSRTSRVMSRRRVLEILGATSLGGATAAILSSSRVPAKAWAQTAAGMPRRGGTLSAAAEADPVSLSPFKVSTFAALQAFEHVYESLITYDAQTNLVPALAERWEVATDGRLYTFHLRPGVRFHTGKPMGAEDVKYSIDKILDPQTASPWRPWLGPVREVKVVDAATLQIGLESPFPGLLGGLASLRASVVLPAGAGEAENLNLTAIGTGPFKLVEYVPQDRLVYARNPDYWDKQLPYLDGMTFKILPDENARLAAVLAGQLQYAVISPQGAAQIAQGGQLSVLKTPFAWVAIMQVNVSRPPLTDPRVRRALRMAVDTNEVIQKSVVGACAFYLLHPPRQR
jgi:peptide/nickel transport system substrate-binding protein